MSVSLSSPKILTSQADTILRCARAVILYNCLTFSPLSYILFGGKVILPDIIRLWMKKIY